MHSSEGNARLLDILLPPGGLCTGMSSLGTSGGDAGLTTRIARLGNLAGVWPNIVRKDGPASVQGVGVGLNAEEATLPALAEALERYCASVYSGEQFLVAPAGELGGDALDLDGIPRCSAAELAHPRCPLRVPDKK